MMSRCCRTRENFSHGSTHLCLPEIIVGIVRLGAVINCGAALKDCSRGHALNKQPPEVRLSSNEVVPIGDIHPTPNQGWEAGGLGPQPGVNNRLQPERRAKGDQQRKRLIDTMRRLIGGHGTEGMTNQDFGICDD